MVIGPSPIWALPHLGPCLFDPWPILALAHLGLAPLGPFGPGPLDSILGLTLLGPFFGPGPLGPIVSPDPILAHVGTFLKLFFKV